MVKLYKVSVSSVSAVISNHPPHPRVSLLSLRVLGEREYRHSSTPTPAPDPRRVPGRIWIQATHGTRGRNQLLRRGGTYTCLPGDQQLPERSRDRELRGHRHLRIGEKLQDQWRELRLQHSHLQVSSWEPTSTTSMIFASTPPMRTLIYTKFDMVANIGGLQ
ncbi:unnamed protein product, partial [Timema podura]|nr:unnamed protein product [Timema podura]